MSLFCKPEFVARKEEPLRLKDSMREPDVSVMRETLDDFAERHPLTAALVVEVAVSSVTPDRENASLYAEAAVAECAIALAEAEQVAVYRRPVDAAYRDRRTYARGETHQRRRGDRREVRGGDALCVGGGSG